MTPAERRLWKYIRKRQIDGHRFRRQHPLGPFIVDFVCFEKRLIVELDGGQHSESEIEARDRYRSTLLEEYGYRVVRFWNNEVLGNLGGVIVALEMELAK